MKRTTVFILLSAGFVLSACHSAHDLIGNPLKTMPSDAQTAQNYQGQWTLRSGTYEGKPLLLSQSSGITLAFEQDKVYGSGGINQYQAPVNIQGKNITIHDIVTTRMAGDVAKMRVESHYLSALRQVTQYQKDNHELILSGEGVQLHFIPAQDTTK